MKVGLGVTDGVMVAVKVGVIVGLGVTDGPNTCPGAQALSTSARKRLTFIALLFVFISNLPS